MCSTPFAQDDLVDPADESATRVEEPQAQASGQAPELDTVIVTAQKRTENLQKVPISIQVLDETRLEEQNISDFDDFARLMPSVSFQSFGPGFSQVYIRGVASGGDGNHSGPLPSVGLYLDEQPITTIQGALDLHIYDIQRVEVLAGPQGTLYGASSQSGTVRIITNKPDPSGFAAGYGIEGNTIDDGGSGYVTEGFVNLPVADNAAIRLVAWSKHDAGYVDNVFGTRTFPTSGITIDNANRAEDDYNDVDTYGLRAALKVDLNDSWSITPTLIHQNQESNGSFGFDPDVGDNDITHFYPERADDRWTQAALTVQGKIGNFDLVYAYAHLKRDVDSESDYNDYAFWYDTLLGYGAYFVDDAGNLINPSQYIQGKDGYSRDTHELRLTSPQDNRLRFVGGLFWQDQEHEIEQRYRVDNLADSLSVTGWPDTIWLTQQVRTDEDRALFGELSYDITDQLTATAGVRFFEADNSLKGYFGFSEGYSGSTGEAACFDQTDFRGAPCINLDKTASDSDHLGRINLTYDIDDDKLVYATWSEGYRPGGINRRGSLPPYVSDFLTNYELGWKTTWLDNRMSFNGAVFQQEWKDFQFALLGANGLTEIKNANQAEIRGLEMEINWAATYNLLLTGGLAFFDAELTENYCGITDDAGNPITVCDVPQAPAGTRLPVTAEFKGNLTGRYSFDLGNFEAYWQGSIFYEGDRTSDLRLIEREILGDLDAYTMVDLSFGLKRDNWALDFFLRNAFDERAELTKFTQCAEAVCGDQTYTLAAQPRTFGVRFSQQF
ncbi:MAG: TonB-dependent receptor [Lysobacterales bacterium]